jgi:hypothetical protein
MERYIGLDAHAASCTLAVISQTGRKLKDFPVETNGEALVSPHTASGPSGSSGATAGSGS